MLRAGLTWRQVAVLRSYAAYLHQAGTRYSRSYVASCLVAHASLVGRLVELFEARFDPALGAADSPSRTQRMTKLTDGALASLDEVAALDEDRILRGFLNLISTTLRTSYYRTDTDPSVVVLKIDAKALPALPEPRPYAELFVCSPRVEGVHLRLGRIARGGLRWSDRREDYRTEVLGLVKAQAVKNAVIGWPRADDAARWAATAGGAVATERAGVQRRVLLTGKDRRTRRRGAGRDRRVPRPGRRRGACTKCRGDRFRLADPRAAR